MAIVFCSPAGNAQGLQAEAGGGDQLADGLQHVHTAAEEDAQGAEAQPATVMGDLGGGGGGVGCFSFPNS